MAGWIAQNGLEMKALEDENAALRALTAKQRAELAQLRADLKGLRLMSKQREDP